MRAAIIIALVAALLLLWAVLHAQPIAVPSPGPQWFPHGIQCPAGVPCGTSTATTAGIGGNTSNSPGSDGIINVKNYGAVCDGATDDSVAIQAALDAAAAATHKYAVYFPPGDCRHNSVLRVTCNGCGVFGATGGVAASYHPSKLSQLYDGPAFIVDGLSAGSGNALTFGTALVGTGNSLNTTVNGYHIMLNEGAYSPINTVHLDGAAGEDIEFWFKTPNPLGAGTGFLLQSNASYGVASGIGAFRIQVDNVNARIQAWASVSTTGIVALNTPNGSIAANTVYDIALDADGSNCRVFINGVAQVLNGGGTTVTCAGTVVQTWAETISVPSGSPTWPNSAGAMAAEPGFIDAIHIQNASVHTSNYTPAVAKPTAGANTVIIENFETPAVDGTQIAHIKSTPGGINTDYLPVYGGGLNGTGVHMHDLELCNGAAGGTGAVVMGWGGEYDHLSCASGNYYGVLSFPPGGVGTFYENVHDNSAGATAASAGDTVNAQATGFFFGNNFTESYVANNTASGVGLTGEVNFGDDIDINTKVLGASPLRFPFYVAGKVAYMQPFDDLEGADAQMLGFMFLSTSGPQAPVIDTAEVLVPNGVPVFVVNGGIGPIVSNVFHYIISGQANELFDFLLAPTTPITLIGSSGIPVIPLTAGGFEQYIHTPGCGGTVTLSSGSGTVSNVCINIGSVCSAVDLTTFTNAVTLSAPENTAGATKGHVDVTGTGSDVIKVSCQ